jgi:hypothetical protein
MAELTDQRIQKLLRNKAKQKEADELEKSWQKKRTMSGKRPQSMSGRNGR